jgi:hypothetical protein
MTAGRIAAAAAIVASASLLGCPIGQRAGDFPSVRTGGGRTCRLSIRATRQEVTGELLSAADTAAVLVAANKVWVVPYRIVRSSRCDDTGSIPFDGRGVLVPAQANELQLRSRYPQGIGPELMARLLQAYGQTAPMVPAQP